MQKKLQQNFRDVKISMKGKDASKIENADGQQIRLEKTVWLQQTHAKNYLVDDFMDDSAAKTQPEGTRFLTALIEIHKKSPVQLLATNAFWQEFVVLTFGVSSISQSSKQCRAQ